MMDSNAHVIQRRTRRRLLSPSEKYEVFVAVLTGQATQRTGGGWTARR
jgi:hypothetical protein